MSGAFGEFAFGVSPFGGGSVTASSGGRGPLPPVVNQNGVGLTPGPTVYGTPLTRLRVVAGGTLKLTLAADGSAVDFGTVPAGFVLENVAVTSVDASSTAAVLGFYR